MKLLHKLTSSLASKINDLVAQAESTNPGMHEVAAMIYVGDVYALREQSQRLHSDGWGRYHYSCDSTGCKPLP